MPKRSGLQVKNVPELLLAVIKQALRDLGLDSRLSAPFYLDLPTDSRFGDLATNIALQLSKSLKKPPREIASCLVEKINHYLSNNPLKESIKEIKIEGVGFINFYLSDKYFYCRLAVLLEKKEHALKINLGKDKKVLVEFVSANPTGSLSLAHARQAAVGDTLANIMEFVNFKVRREYYLNDEGNQIDILGESVALRLKEMAGEKIEFPENYYQGEYVYDIAKESQSHHVTKSQELSEFALQYILNIIKKELVDFGVKFDFWRSQKELRKSGKIEKALEELKKRGYLYEQEGAKWFKSSALGDDKDRVVVKSDGSYTYLAPDIAYHQEKYRRGFDMLINLWGPDHHGYINRLKAAVEALGHPAQSLSIIIVQLATIFRDGKPVQMSTRKGQYITLREVLDEVGVNASRYFFLMRRTSSHLDFDLDVAKKETAENPVYYVQYAHARICSILRSSQIKPDKKSGLDLLKEKEELSLIKKILQFTSVLNICVITLDPYMLTVYLQELAEAFHKFYDLHRVLGQDEALTKARLALIEATRIALAAGLELLGVSKPQSM